MNRLNKARNIFRSLNNVWKSSQYSKQTKLKLYQSCILSTLLYGSECWRMTENELTKLSVFHSKSIRRILRIFWPNKISNEDLLRQCKQEDMATILLRRRWKWIGHVIRKDRNSIIRTALHWTPEGKCKRDRPKNTWTDRNGGPLLLPYMPTAYRAVSKSMSPAFLVNYITRKQQITNVKVDRWLS